MNNPITKIRDLAEVTTGLGRIGASLVADRVRTAAGIPRLRDCDACGGVAYELRTVDGETACISCVETEREDEYQVRVDALGHANAAKEGLRRDLDDARARADSAEAMTRKWVDEYKLSRSCISEVTADLAAANARADKAEAAATGLHGELVIAIGCGDMAMERAIKAESCLADLTRIHDEALAALSVAIQRAETAEAEVDRATKAHHVELRAAIEAKAEAERGDMAMMAERNEYYTEVAELRVNIVRISKELWQRVRKDDHACGRCVEGGPIVRDGFVCAHHLAEDYLAIERERSAAAEVES